MRASKVCPIVVTDYSLCNALGVTREQAISALRDGRTGLSAPPFELPFGTVAGRVPSDFEPLPAGMETWDSRPARMAVHLTQQLDASLTRARQRWSDARIGLLLGTSTAGAEATERAYGTFAKSGALPADYDFRRQHAYGAVLDVIRRWTGLRGPSWMISTTCTSSAKPLASALRLIAMGRIDAAIVGGIDTLCAMTLTGFHSLDALSDTYCKPFSSERNGINIGEGGAFLLVERQGDGKALIEAVGESSDAYHISAPHPNGEGASTAMERALEMAGCEAGDVDCVNAHGTATPLNDIAEGRAIARVFGSEIPVVSTKGYTGHALGGAGATEAALSIIALEEGWLPESLGAGPVDPRLEINICRERQPGDFKRILSNSFAFGGNNVCVLLRSQ